MLPHSPSLPVTPPFVAPPSYTSICGPSQLHLHLWSLPQLQLHFWSLPSNTTSICGPSITGTAPFEVPHLQLQFHLWSLNHSSNSICGHSLTVPTLFVVTPSQLQLLLWSLPHSYNSICGLSLTVICGPSLSVTPPFIVPSSHLYLHLCSLTVTPPFMVPGVPHSYNSNKFCCPPVLLHLLLWSLPRSYNSICGPSLPVTPPFVVPSLPMAPPFVVPLLQLHLNLWSLPSYISICGSSLSTS